VKPEDRTSCLVTELGNTEPATIGERHGVLTIGRVD